MELRVEQLAAQADVSVDTVRFYQAKGLLPPPRREGRVAWYGDDHLARLARIRSLQAKGLNLATIRRLLDGELDAADEALVTAVTSAGDHDRLPAPGLDAEETFGLDELAARSGIPLPLVEAVARDGLLVPRRVKGREVFTPADVEIAAAGLALLEAGLPLAEVLELARRHHAAMREVAERAVELFDSHVRQALRAEGLADDVAAQRLVDAFSTLLPATTKLVTHHFRRTLLAVAQEHIERVGGDAELAAVAGAADPERAT
ncbi:MAG TPA: MerR family transcriptional regulator [Acidimicrobiales bacterium]|nr:MerR family transcriptional regulator [Acidimicrobiales bacterium]